MLVCQKIFLVTHTCLIFNHVNPAISDVVVGCPAIYLEYAKQQAPENIQVAAQNAYKVPSGAFTGNYFFNLIFVGLENISYQCITRFTDLKK